MSRLYEQACALLADRARFGPDVRFVPEGRLHTYLEDPAMNLVAGVVLDDVRKDMDGGAGNELKRKFRAPHSSSALAVNTFARFRVEGAKVPIPGHGSMSVVGFEQKRPHGLASEAAPNLDVELENDGRILAIESKFLEFLDNKDAVFSRMYINDMPEARRGVWYEHMIDIAGGRYRYKALDVAQLIKHAYGLAHCHKGKDVTLLYLFWEPENPQDHARFAQHRGEVDRFQRVVQDEQVRFEALSYPELWASWDTAAGPDWLSEHVGNLRRRYAVTIPA